MNSMNRNIAAAGDEQVDAMPKAVMMMLHEPKIAMKAFVLS
jgi:hypothetical protein